MSERRGKSSIHDVIVNRLDPFRLTGRPDLEFRAVSSVNVIQESGGWEPLVIRYSYEVASRGVELVAFHWHPMVVAVPYPHLHVGPAAAVGNREFAGSHLPTGFLELSWVVRFLVEELGAGRR